MPNIIRIKRSTGSTAPTQLKNAELAYAEGNNIFYIGRGTQPGTDIATEIVKIGGAGAYLTTDTAQTIASTGTKTFSVGASGTLKINGGAAGNILTTNGSGELSWTAPGATDSFRTIRGDSGSVSASGSETFDITGTSPVSVNVNSVNYNSNTGLGKQAVISVAAASTSAAGIVQLDSTLNSTSETKAATAKALSDTYTIANAALPKSGGTMTGTLTLASSPSYAMDAATKQYVDNVATGLDVKASVRVATTGPITGITYNSTGGASARGQIVGSLPTIIDGVNLSTGNRILLKDQSSAAQNGIWIASASGTWNRAGDFDSDQEVTPGAFTFVEEGTVNADTGWVLTTNGQITVGGASGSALTFSQFSGAGQVEAGNGLTKTGNVLDVVGTTGRIVANADAIDLATVTQTDNDTGTAGINFVQSITKDAYGRISGRVLANVRTASTSQTGVIQLVSTVGTETDKVPTSGAVRTYVTTEVGNLASTVDGTVLKLDGSSTMEGKLKTVASTTSAASINLAAGPNPTNPVAGDIWRSNAGNAEVIKVFVNGDTRDIAYTNSNITGTAAGLSSVLAVSKGGTGITSFGSGIASFLQTPSSANLASALTDKTGSGIAVFATSPALVTPSLGVATATSINKVSITAPTNNATLTIADGKTLQVNNSFALNGTGTTTTVNFGGGGTVAYTNSKLSAFAATTSAEMAGVLEDETGYSSGALVVFNTSPTFRTSVGTSSSQFELFNENANKITAFGAATDISIGATSGTTLIKNKLKLADASSTLASINIGAGTVDPGSPMSGDFWQNAGTIKFRYGADTKTLLLSDSTLDGGDFN